MNAFSQIGIIIFMFLVGLGINTRELKKQGHAALLTSHISITGLWSSISGIVLPATP